MWKFQPTVLSTSRHIELPRPITACRITDRWAATRFEVPLREGDIVRGRTRRGVDISIRGQLGRVDGHLVTGEIEMFDALDEMREILNGESATTFAFALFSNEIEERGFRECSVSKLEYDLSDAAIFSYSLIIHASDPKLYQAVSLLD